jgi:hypothetical protein
MLHPRSGTNPTLTVASQATSFVTTIVVSLATMRQSINATTPVSHGADADPSKRKAGCNSLLSHYHTLSVVNSTVMQVTYAQLFKFMGTFTNQELDDAQTIAEHAHQDLGKSYNQVLVDVLVEMRQHQLAN